MSYLEIQLLSGVSGGYIILSGYGILIGSKENAAGLGLQCQYLTARGTSTAQYVHTKSGIIGLSDCPLLRKSTVIIDNG
ncbi:YobH family protein [Citrobacter freundii]|uniref:YobH family protein n=1 Tax=Citrobacter freundii TaxID=546 RepID=UPI0027A7AFAB|nr:hypothetical protein O9240_12875 [Citrobacter freundii]